MYTYIYIIYIYIYMYTYVYIYTYIHRERERESKLCKTKQLISLVSCPYGNLRLSRYTIIS